MTNLLKWLRKKRNEDTTFAQFLKLGFSIGQKSWIHAIISAISGIVIPLFFSSGQYILFTILLLILICDILYAYICNEYQQNSYKRRKFASKILADESSLLKSIVIEMENNFNWKNKIFGTVSNLVCEKLYQNFKEVFNCETRIAVEYTFYKNTKSSQKIEYVKMAGRRSVTRSTVRKSTLLEKRKKYYSYKIFVNNNNGINILDTAELHNEDIWYTNPKNNTDIKKYVGIAVSVYDENQVKFILEIDFIDDFSFGENNDSIDIETFIEQYLMAYINIISISYLLNLNNKKEIPEV